MSANYHKWIHSAFWVRHVVAVSGRCVDFPSLSNVIFSALAQQDIENQRLQLILDVLRLPRRGTLASRHIALGRLTFRSRQYWQHRKSIRPWYLLRWTDLQHTSTRLLPFSNSLLHPFTVSTADCMIRGFLALKMVSVLGDSDSLLSLAHYLCIWLPLAPYLQRSPFYACQQSVPIRMYPVHVQPTRRITIRLDMVASSQAIT